MKLVSFNCQSVRRSVDQIRELCNDCTVVALQETWLMPNDIVFLDRIHDNYSSVGTSAVDTSQGVLRGRPYGGVAILWNTTALPNVEPIDCKNPSVCAIKFNVDGNVCLCVSVYMPQNKPENVPDFTSILSLIQSIIIEHDINLAYVLGDFNADINSLFWKELTECCSDNGLIIADYEFLKSKDNVFTYVSYAHGTTSWLDHCVTSRQAMAATTAIEVREDVFWSDHKPLLVHCDFSNMTRQVSIDNPSSQSSDRWGSRCGEQIEEYASLCAALISNLDWTRMRELSSCVGCESIDHRHIIDSTYKSFIGCLREAARGNAERGAGADRHRRRRMPVAGWNQHVREAHDAARAHYRAWLEEGSPRDGFLFDNMKESRTIFKSRLRFCQNNQQQVILDQMSRACQDNKFQEFWKCSSKVLNTKKKVSDNVEGICDHVGIANLFKNKFLVESGPDSGGTGGAVPPDGANWHVSERAVADALRKMSSRKAVGHDNISVEHLRYGGPWVVVFLSVFLNMCIKHSHLPKDMLKTVITPIVKNKSGNLSDSSNYRPISLATTCAKLYDSIILNLLSKHIKINDAQFGFQKGNSTDFAIFTLKQTVQYYVDRRTDIYACFLDLSRAFDRVDYRLLWEKLRGAEVPADCINLLRAWYRSQPNVVRWRDAQSDEFSLQCGVRQGGLTSPLLFNLYINSLIEELSSTRLGCHLGTQCVNNLSYADDMVLLSPSIAALRQLLSHCELYAKKHNLIYNVKKSVCMVFRKNKANKTLLPVFLEGKQLEWVQSFRYLGHVLTPDLRDSLDLDRERRALSVRANMIGRRFCKCSRDSKHVLFRTYCQALYTPQLWSSFTREDYRRLKVQYNDAYRVLFRLPRWCSASEMFSQARLAGLGALIRHRVARFRDRLFASGNLLVTTITSCFTNFPIFRYWTRLLGAIWSAP